MRENKRKWILWGSLFLLFFGMSHTVFGQQDTLLFRTSESKKAKTKIHSLHFSGNIGFVLPPKDNTHFRLRYGNSMQGTFGIQWYARLAKFYKIGFGLTTSGTSYCIRQDKGKWFIDTNLNRRESFSTGELSLAFNHQFKLNKTSKPCLLEASVYGSYVYSGEHRIINVDYNSDDIYSGKTRTKTIHRKLNYLERWIWGLQLKLTYHGIGIYAQYRMSKLVKLGRPADYSSFDMPQLSVGVTFSGEIFNF